MDSYSHFMASWSKAFWDAVSYFVSTIGYGLVLACGALWHGGFIIWGVGVAGIVGGLVLAWVSGNWKKRYLRWVRQEDGGRL